MLQTAKVMDTVHDKWCGSWPVVSVSCGSNGQIHRDYRNPVEKRDSMAALQVRERAATLAWTAFIAFLGTLHRGWSSFTMHVMLLITSEKKDIYKCKEESG